MIACKLRPQAQGNLGVAWEVGAERDLDGENPGGALEWILCKGLPSCSLVPENPAPEARISLF